MLSLWGAFEWDGWGGWAGARESKQERKGAYPLDR